MSLATNRAIAACFIVLLLVGLLAPAVLQPHPLQELTWIHPCRDGHCRPTFIIIGAGKSGTSSLYHYLTSHPHIKPALSKQTNYFDSSLYDTHDLSWYLTHFPAKLAAGHITGEASPGYLAHPRVPSLILAAMPDVRIIAILRNPVERAVSSFNYNFKSHAVGAPFTSITIDALILSELAILQHCLDQHTSIDPLLDLGAACYAHPMAQIAHVLVHSHIHTPAKVSHIIVVTLQ